MPAMIARTICTFSRGVANARRAFNYSQQHHPRKLACWNAVAARAFNREESASASCLTAGLSLALVASGCGAATNCGWFSSDVPEQQSSKLEELYEVEQRVLGEGCFGAVRMVRRRSGSNGRGDGFVVKTIELYQIAFSTLWSWVGLPPPAVVRDPIAYDMLLADFILHPLRAEFW